MATGIKFHRASGAVMTIVYGNDVPTMVAQEDELFGVADLVTNPADVWFEDYVAQPRQDLPRVDCPRRAPLGGSITLHGLPSDCWVQVGPDFIRSNEGRITLASYEPIQHTVRFVGRYIHNDIELEWIDLPVAKAKAIETVNGLATYELASGFIWSEARYDGDEAAQNAILKVVTNCIAGVELPDDFAWRDFDNVDHPIDRDGVIALSGAMQKFAQAIRAQTVSLKFRINKALSLEELDSIDLHQGWPD